MNPVQRLIVWLDSLSPRTVGVTLSLLGALLAARLLGLTWLMAVNVPFSDQWALLTPLFNGFQWSDVPRAFFWQHGPHRQGLPFSLVLPGYHFSDWNVRLDSLWIACLQLSAGALVLRLRLKLLPAAPLAVWDALLLLGFWGVCTFETILVAPNASHSIGPLFLLMLLLNAWLSPPGARRTGGIALLVVALGFTGFGLTALPVLALVILLDAWRGPRSQRPTAWLLLAVCLLTLAGFLVNYRFVVAADDFQVLHPEPLEYVRFVVAMLSYFLLMIPWPLWWVVYPAGTVFLLAAMVLMGWGLRHLWQRPDSAEKHTSRDFWQVCLILVGCSLAFAFLTAYGRVQLGLPAAIASRYSALLLPALAAFYLLLLLRARHRAGWALLMLLMLFLLRTVPESVKAYYGARYAASMKLCWMDQYRSSGQVKEADLRLSALDERQAYQAGWMGRQVQWDYLMRHRLGPFAQNAEPAPLLALHPEPCSLLKATQQTRQP